MNSTTAGPPDLMQLLAQLAAPPADQRAALARLLTPTNTATPSNLDDKVPPGYERDGAPRGSSLHTDDA